MRRKRIVGAVILFFLAGLVGVEFLQLNRVVPPARPLTEQADRIIVFKAERRLDLMRGNILLKSYAVALGGNPVGHKLQEGDRRTPEGLYAIDFAHPRSRFHLALRLSYPSPADRADAARRNVDPGSDIMIHGLPNGLGFVGRLHRMLDWTNGCVAVTNSEIEDIWSRVVVGTPVEIRV